MANKFKLETTAIGRGVKKTSIEFVSWSCYPQQTNKKTEVINRIGSNETIIQTLFESSMPTPCTAVLFLHNSNITAIRAEEKKINKMVGVDCKLTDSINNGTYEKLVITDLSTKIKAVNKNSWMLVCEFNQFLRIPEKE